jgi:hypothetical protein
MNSVTFLEAVAREKGWLDASSLCRRNNNPGDIEWGKFAESHGAAHIGRFAKFPSPEAGFAAMKVLFCGPAYLNLTVAEAIAKWAPSTENDTARYVRNVCLWAEVSPDEHIADVLSAA